MWTIAFVYFLSHFIFTTCRVDNIETGCWPNNVVPYVIEEGFTKDQVKMIERHVVELARVTCVRWVNVVKVPLNNTDYVQFHKTDNSKVCQVLKEIRYDNQSKAIITMGDKCFITTKFSTHYFNPPVVLQLMLHVMGIKREHQRADRNCYVTIDHDEVERYQYGTDRFDIRHVPWMERFPYDKHSVMHFPRSSAVMAKTEALESYDHVAYECDDLGRKRWYYNGDWETCVLTTRPAYITGMRVVLLSSEYWYSYRFEPLGNKGELSFLDVWKLNYRFCHFPHYCEIFPLICDLMDKVEKDCVIRFVG